MRLVGYTYHADVRCKFCMPDGFVDDGTFTDPEGNTPAAIHDTDEWDYIPTCEVCRETLDTALTLSAWMDKWRAENAADLHKYERQIAKLRQIVGSADGEELPAYAWPGGYQMIYGDDSGNTICPECANNALSAYNANLLSGEGSAWFYGSDLPSWADVYYEGPNLYCDVCNTEIEAAYGDPDAESDTEGQKQ